MKKELFFLTFICVLSIIALILIYKFTDLQISSLIMGIFGAIIGEISLYGIWHLYKNSYTYIRKNFKKHIKKFINLITFNGTLYYNRNHNIETTHWNNALKFKIGIYTFYFQPIYSDFHEPKIDNKKFKEDKNYNSSLIKLDYRKTQDAKIESGYFYINFEPFGDICFNNENKNTNKKVIVDNELLIKKIININICHFIKQIWNDKDFLWLITEQIKSRFNDTKPLAKILNLGNC